MSRRLNSLRAGVLGANDGIVSTAAVVVGVAGASTGVRAILIAGLVAVIGGAISMALGEYVSVSSQRDTERDVLHLETKEQVSPWHAAIASFLTFAAGAVLPMLAITLPPAELRVPVTFVAVLVALAVTGAVAARIGGSKPGRAALRLVVGGALALLVTYALGTLIGGVTV
jgi:VIT1/CCC1 family predicted Fe2+/Mn2+ transporter